MEPTPINNERLLAGIIVQPFLAAATALLTFPMWFITGDGRLRGAGSVSGDAGQSLAFGVGIVAGAITFFGVLPTVLWLTKRRRVSFIDSLMFGLAFANLPIFVVTLLAGGSGPAGLLGTHGFASVIGLTCAAAFWAIALRTQNARA